MRPDASIFERVGGFATVSRIVSSFYDRVLSSPELAPYFAATDMRRLIDHQTKFVSTLMGGPVSYTDEHLAHIHARLGIDDRAFDETAELLRETLEDFDLDEGDIASVYGAFAGHRAYIVTRSRTPSGSTEDV